MKDRQSYTTKAADLEERVKAWEEAIDTAREHVKLGGVLKGQGVEIIRAIEKHGGSPADVGRLIQQASTTIDRGVRIEREARREIMELQQIQPK